MRYKGFSTRIEFDAEDEIFFGKLAGITDGVGFHADTAKGLLLSFREAVDDYIESYASIGRNPQKPVADGL